MLQTIKDKREKYGRYLAEIWLIGEDGTAINLNDLIVEKGYAVYKKY
jgi:endonuclease YncB( thermonuclease family)